MSWAAAAPQGNAIGLYAKWSPALDAKIEAVVQRIPEFCDPSQPPETEVAKLTNGQQHNPLLNQINRTLGRRFVILSTRTLTQKDL